MLNFDALLKIRVLESLIWYIKNFLANDLDPRIFEDAY